jgi:hypothetical protein
MQLFGLTSSLDLNVTQIIKLIPENRPQEKGQHSLALMVPEIMKPQT